MKSQKITDSLRYAILRNINEDVMGEVAKEAEAALAHVCDEIYAQITQPFLRTLNALPQGVVPERSSFRVSFTKDGSNSNTLNMTVPRRVWAGANYSVAPFCYIDPSDKLAERYFEHASKVRDINDKRTTLRNEASSIIKTCTTTKKLIEIWPEAEQYIPKPDAPLETPLAKRTEELNTMIQQLKKAS